jgi:hypothetical protein
MKTYGRTLLRAGLSILGVSASLLLVSACGERSPGDSESIGESTEAICDTAIPSYGPIVLWPGGIIPYKYDTQTPQAKAIAGDEISSPRSGLKGQIRDAMDRWQVATDNRVRFVYSSSHTDGLVFKSIYSTVACSVPPGDPVAKCPWNACVSDPDSPDFGKCLGDKTKACSTTECTEDFPVCDYERELCRVERGCGGDPGAGYGTAPGTQPEWVDPDNLFACNLNHELGHTLGLGHEHQRYDRDSFIEIHENLLPCSNGDAWWKFVRTEDDPINLGPYDLSGAMQYNAFDNPETIGVFDPNMTVRATGAAITTGFGPPTALDGAKVVEMYSRVTPQWKRAVRVASSVGPILQGFSPALARTPSRLNVFTTGRDGHVYRRTTSAYGKPDWSSAQDLGFTATSSPGATAIDGKAAVAVFGPGGNVYVAQEVEGWTWDNRGKPNNVTLAWDPVLVSTASNKLHILVVGLDGNLYQKTRTGSTWSGWGPPLGGGILRGGPAAASLLDGNMHVFSNSAGGQLVQSAVTGNSWSGFFNVASPGACCLAVGSSPTVSYSHAGRIDILYRGTNDRMKWLRWKPTGWSPATDLGNYLTSNPAAVALGTNRVDTAFIGADDRLWYRQHAVGRVKGDFDGDGRGDFAFYRPSEKRWHITPYNGDPYFVQFAGNVMFNYPDDFDNDGVADPVVYDTDTSAWILQRSTEKEERTVRGMDKLFTGKSSWGVTTDRFLNGDFDGDGLADYAYYRGKSTQKWFVAPNHGGPSFEKAGFGVDSDVILPADYDGDGTTDLAYWRPSEGRWYISESSTGALVQKQLGWSTDSPVPADYDGDGKADVAVYSKSTGGWAYLPSSTGSTVPSWQVLWLTPNDRPVPKDYDGDGKTDPAVFSPAGQWLVAKSTGGTTTLSFGAGTDVPF